MTSPSDMTPAPNIDGLIKRLRSTRANMLGTDDERHYWACHERHYWACHEAADVLAALRAERDAALALLREAREWVDAAEHPSYGPYRQAVELCARIDAALAAKEK